MYNHPDDLLKHVKGLYTGKYTISNQIVIDTQVHIQFSSPDSTAHPCAVPQFIKFNSIDPNQIHWFINVLPNAQSFITDLWNSKLYSPTAHIVSLKTLLYNCRAHTISFTTQLYTYSTCSIPSITLLFTPAFRTSLSSRRPENRIWHLFVVCLIKRVGILRYCTTPVSDTFETKWHCNTVQMVRTSHTLHMHWRAWKKIMVLQRLLTHAYLHHIQFTIPWLAKCMTLQTCNDVNKRQQSWVKAQQGPNAWPELSLWTIPSQLWYTEIDMVLQLCSKPEPHGSKRPERTFIWASGRDKVGSAPSSEPQQGL